MRSEEVKEGFYLYGIVDARVSLPRDTPGLGGRPVQLIPYHALAALASRSPLSPYPVDLETAALHETVVETAMEAGTILPMRFNTILPDEERILALLREHYEAFAAHLCRLHGKVEIGLKVLWNPLRFREEAETITIQAGGPGQRYLVQRLLEHWRAKAIRERANAMIDRIQATLAPLAGESVIRCLPTERLLLDASYLVPEEAQEAFRAGLRPLEVEMSELRFLLTGPWPPYSFVPRLTSEWVSGVGCREIQTLPPTPCSKTGLGTGEERWRRT